MSFLGGLLGREERGRVNPAHPRDPVLAAMFSDGTSILGENITEETARRVGAVDACVSLISETLAALPLNVMRRRGSTRERADQHPLHVILHDQPNDEHTAFELRQMLISSTCLVGDAYALIDTDSRGRVQALRPLETWRCRAERSPSGQLRIRYTPKSGNEEVLLPDEVLRLPHRLKSDGITALSPIGVHRETIGLALAAQRYLAGFYRNSAMPKGALKVPTPLTPEAVGALRKSFEARHQGPENAGRLMVLDGGMEWQSTGLTMEDAQYVELQQLSVSDIARIYLVPPHKIGDLSKATFSNIEQQAIEFATDTLYRWCARVEQRMNVTLLSAVDRAAGYYVDFDLKGLLRGDSAARAAFYRGLYSIGAMSPNEIRSDEGLNPYDGGDSYWVQGANVPVEVAMSGGQENDPMRIINDRLDRLENGESGQN